MNKFRCRTKILPHFMDFCWLVRKENMSYPCLLEISVINVQLNILMILFKNIYKYIKINIKLTSCWPVIHELIFCIG